MQVAQALYASLGFKEISLSAQQSCYAEQAVRLEPEIVSGEVINRRIYEQNFRFHNFVCYMREIKCVKKL